MSKNGDVVWADGMAWQRDNQFMPNDKQWWIAPAASYGAGHKTLKELKQHADFRWLVEDGQPQDGYDDGQLAMWDSHARTLGFDRNKHQSFKAALADRCNQAAQAERETIIAWLMEGEDTDSESWMLGDCILRGEHLRSDDE